MANYIQVAVGRALTLAGYTNFRRVVSLRVEILNPTNARYLAQIRRLQEFRL